MSGQQREVVMRFLSAPTDINYAGKVHGGQVMKWIDQVGYAAALGWCGQACVTVAVGGIRFVAPIQIGPGQVRPQHLEVTRRQPLHDVGQRVIHRLVARGWAHGNHPVRGQPRFRFAGHLGCCG